MDNGTFGASIILVPMIQCSCAILSFSRNGDDVPPEPITVKPFQDRVKVSDEAGIDKARSANTHTGTV